MPLCEKLLAFFVNIKETYATPQNIPMKIKSYVPCGAKLKSGQPCAKPPVKGEKRCRLHGGITALRGADSPTARPNDSLYTKFMTPEEVIAFHEMELGTVDAEIKLARTRLARAMKMEEQDAMGELPDATTGRPPRGEELESRIERDGGGPTTVHEERHYRKVDYRAAIHACLSRIESLEKTRAELAKMANGGGSEDLVAALTKLADRLPV